MAEMRSKVSRPLFQAPSNTCKAKNALAKPYKAVTMLHYLFYPNIRPMKILNK